ncbi:MAG TPA: glycosyl hydrolase family 18 protein [Isosphaeraceae bacterium]|jgi:spore germination protein YaaH|nr:glycosyl hydrolase family 18 protein [Isosphaeraceae bacterium]
MMPRLAWIGVALSFLATPLKAQEKVVAYVPNWIDLKSFAETIDYSKITHINIAFESPTDDRGDLSFHREDEVLIAKAHDHHVKVLVSIGGGAAAGNRTLKARYFGLISEPKRAGFAAKLAAYVVEHGFDGLDVDIEGPSINQDYGPLIRELSAALKPKGKLLTAALSKGYGGERVPDSVFEHFDFVNVMAYDGAGPWNPNAPGQHSSPEFAGRNVDYWLKRGLPASKAVLGVPFYGYGFGKAFRKGAYSYKAIVAAHPDADRADQVGETIWYNGVATIEAKTRYAIDRKLAGIMIWSLDNDVAGEKSLLEAIARTYRSRGAADPPAPGEDRVGFPKDYATAFEVLRRVERLEKRQVVTVFGNARAASVRRVGDLPYPYGSVIVMETAGALKGDDGEPRRDEEGRLRKGDVVGLHVMRREKGLGAAYGANRTGDWEYVEYRTEGTYITPPRKSFACAACHVKAGSGRDFVYRGRFPETLEK